jgi:hypothetical protein
MKTIKYIITILALLAALTIKAQDYISTGIIVSNIDNQNTVLYTLGANTNNFSIYVGSNLITGEGKVKDKDMLTDSYDLQDKQSIYAAGAGYDFIIKKNIYLSLSAQYYAIYNIYQYEGNSSNKYITKFSGSEFDVSPGVTYKNRLCLVSLSYSYNKSLSFSIGINLDYKR